MTTGQQLRVDEMVQMPAGSLPDSRSRFEMLPGAKEHEMHHRGQLMVIERLLGIVPHLTGNHQATSNQTKGKLPSRRQQVNLPI